MVSTFTHWLENKAILESLSRHCEIYKSNTGKWWMELADEEYGEQWDSSVYGPFTSQDEAETELKQHSNPGAVYDDASGERQDPTSSPNGGKIREPEIRRKSKYLW